MSRKHPYSWKCKKRYEKMSVDESCNEPFTQKTIIFVRQKPN